jgi:hypothetical protein
MLFSTENAPQYNKDVTEEVVKYVDSTMCCQRTSDNQEMREFNHFTSIQAYMRLQKRYLKNPAVYKFGFPRYPMMRTKVLQPLNCNPTESQKHANYMKNTKSFLNDLNICDGSLTMTQFLQLINLSYEDHILANRFTVRSDTSFLKRAPDELSVNNYNVHCLMAWRSKYRHSFCP